MKRKLLNIGFGNRIVAEDLVAIVSPNSAPVKRMKDEAKTEGRLVDATQGRKTRSVMVMNSNHVVLSAIHPETISQRFVSLNGSKTTDHEEGI
ncbi:MAG: DUF370 domain-containing protein [Thermodesulfobacteriota bacterium]|nr:DUF370 domain-containing protein [Thermodesulfobacteriota bacterium]